MNCVIRLFSWRRVLLEKTTVPELFKGFRSSVKTKSSQKPASGCLAVRSRPDAHIGVFLRLILFNIIIPST